MPQIKVQHKWSKYLETTNFNFELQTEQIISEVSKNQDYKWKSS